MKVELVPFHKPNAPSLVHICEMTSSTESVRMRDKVVDVCGNGSVAAEMPEWVREGVFFLKGLREGVSSGDVGIK